MARRRKKGYVDVEEVNAVLGQMIKSYPDLEELGLMTEDIPQMEPLVVSLQTFKDWLRRRKVLGAEDLPAARLRFEGMANVLIQQLKQPRATELGVRLTRQLALFGRDLVYLAKR